MFRMLSLYLYLENLKSRNRRIEMKPVLSTEEVRRLEDLIEKEGTSKAELMELAGEFVASLAFWFFADLAITVVTDGWPPTFLVKRVPTSTL